MSDPRAADCAAAIVAAFARYNAEFRAITRRAPERFENRDWSGSQADVVERLELYATAVNATVADMRKRLGDAAHDTALWAGIKADYLRRIESLADPEFLKTFFSSITRKLFDTIGVDPDVEFFALELDPLRGASTENLTERYVNRGSLDLLFEELLSDYRFRTPWRDFESSVGHVTADVELRLKSLGETRPLREIEVIRPVFYQLSRAYLVGRLHGEGWTLPIAIAFRNSPLGVLVDAVMLAVADVSILFSFTRSYFHVDLERVSDAVLFLHAIMPAKPVSELFTVLGRAKQGKTERFREIFRHLGSTSDRFVRAPGERGLVMACFALENADVIFKVIRDRFPAVKNVRREEVMAKYDMVFRHDRAGRLVDAQEFRRIRLPKGRFAPDMLERAADRVRPERAAGRRGPDRRARLHRTADDPAQSLYPQRLARAGGVRGDRLRPGDPRPRLHEYLRRRPAAQEFRRDAPQPRDLLRLRRTVPGDRLPLPRRAARRPPTRTRCGRRAGSTSARTTCSRRPS